METEIFYFTGTGNTLALVRKLAEKLGDTEVSSIAGFQGETVKVKTQSVGIVFPVYAFGMPRIMRRFVEHLEIPDDTYVFGVCNSGGMPGSALIELKRLLKTKGCRLACGFCLVMPPNYLPFGGPGALEQQKKHFSRSEQQLEEIAGIVGQMKIGRIEKTPCVPHFFSALVHKLFLMRMNKDVRKFMVNLRCNSCSICSRVCPTGNIQLASDGKPVWGDNCEQCMACIQWCPQKAIQIRRVSENCPHYHHPDVSVNDMFVR